VEGGQVSVEGGLAGIGQGEPGAGPFALVALGDLDVPGVFEDGHVLGQQRVADFHQLAQEPEIGSVGGRQR
jgi:hypothetical protein